MKMCSPLLLWLSLYYHIFRVVIAYQEIFTSHACFDTNNAEATTIFSAPLDGTITGFTLIYSNGSMTCGNTTDCSSENNNYFTCCGESNSPLYIQLLKMTNESEIYGQTLFPTNNTDGIINIENTNQSECESQTSSQNECKISNYQMEMLNSSSDTLTIIDNGVSLINVSSNETYMIQICDSICRLSNNEKHGTLCYQVYFLYQSIHINETDKYITVYDEYTQRNWFESLLFCQTMFGTSLASIHSYQDKTHLYNSVYNSDEGSGTLSWTWIGLNNWNLSNYSSWEWSDGSFVNESESVINWGTGQPDSALSEHCVVLKISDVTNYYYHNYHCDTSYWHQFACNQKDETNAPSIIPSTNPTVYPTHDPTSPPSYFPSPQPNPSTSTASNSSFLSTTHVSTTIIAVFESSLNQTRVPTSLDKQNTELPNGVTFGINNNVLFIVIVTIGIVLCICMISLFIYCHKLLQGKKQTRETELNQIVQKVLAALPSRNNGSNEAPNLENHENRITSARTKGQSIDLQRSGNAGEIDDNGTIEGKVDVNDKNIDTEIVYDEDDEGDDHATKQTK